LNLEQRQRLAPGPCEPRLATLNPITLAAAPFMIDVGISSTWHIARFWGLAEPGLE
jgi:poly(3-hydroxybutyrate) depolymerase